MIDDKKTAVPRLHAAIADAEAKKTVAEKEVQEFDKGARKSEGVLHELAAQRFHAAVDTQLLANRAVDQVRRFGPPGNAFHEVPLH